jgi:DNA-binding transcriptional ArsR family regulator
VVFRIHFTAEDLARTRIAGSPRPLLEANFAVRMLGERSQPPRLGAWRRQVLDRLPRNARVLFELMPPRGYTPMFLNPNRSGGVAEQLEFVCAASRSEIRREMTSFAARHAVSGWARELEGDRKLLGRLAEALDQVYAAAVAPYWADVCASFSADRATRARDLLDGGIDRLLAGLHPERIRWVPPVLEVLTVSRLRGELRLDGRGLLLVPTVFGPEAPTIDPTGEQPCLTYPARHDGSQVPLVSAGRGLGPDGVPPHLVALLGRTRAAVLHAIVRHPGCSTSDLATAARVSASSASEHATVLRAAGLITTVRHRQTALHAPTPAGSSLLAGP